MIFSREIPFPLDEPPEDEPPSEATGDQTETDLEVPTRVRDPKEEMRQLLSPGEPGRYTVLRKIGSGGMGTVYNTYDHKIERFAAMKRLSPDRADLGGIKRFFNEAKAIARLNHPNIVTIFDINEDKRGFFILMEYVRGLSMRVWVRKWGPIPPVMGLGMIHQVAQALRYAHRQGVIHRDIKPGNILVAQGLHPKLVDFGVALIGTEEGEPGRRRIAGTHGYMAPEQRWKGRPADERSDIYAFAQTTAEILVGQKPWLIKKMPPEIEPFVLRGTAENPKKRFANMGEVIEAVEELMEHFSGMDETVPESVNQRIEPPAPCREYLQTLSARSRRYPLRKPITYVGRSGESADIVLEDTEVSRRHAKVVRSAWETYIFDLQSKNGIAVNDKNVSVVRCRDGMEMVLGGTRLRFVVEEDSSGASR
jgi:serine/threonine protein kinase